MGVNNVGDHIVNLEQTVGLLERLSTVRPEYSPMADSVRIVSGALRSHPDFLTVVQDGRIDFDLEKIQQAMKVYDIVSELLDLEDPDEIKKRLNELLEGETPENLEDIYENSLYSRALLDGLQLAMAIDGKNHYLQRVTDIINEWLTGG